MKYSEIIALVLAAGKGTRMKSSLPKVLHRLLGLPLLGHVVDLLKVVGVDSIFVVVGHGAEKVRETFKGWPVTFVIQKEQLGTGHAVKTSETALAQRHGQVLIMCGDAPLFLPKTLENFIHSHKDSGNKLSILSARFSDPTGYGRIIRDKAGRFKKIVEEKDASPSERAISEVNTGTYLVDKDVLFEVVQKIGCDNAQGEFYLTDIVELASGSGYGVDAFSLASEEEALGVNSRSQLATAERILLSRVREKWMAEGVTFSMPETTYIEKDVKIGKDTLVGPFCILKGSTVIGEGVQIGAHSFIQDTRVPAGAKIKPYSYLIGT